MTTSSPSPVSPADTAPVIELDGVSKSYREGEVERPVLSDLSLRLYPGELAVLVGRSGSGKSTLLNLIGGVDVPTAGRVVVDGVEISALDEEGRTLFRRERIGFIFQFFNLLPTLTVEENLLLPLELKGLTGERWRDKALGLLHEVGLGDRAATFPDRLSGGEQQRVAVARALVHEPALVLADEPTGNLDLDTGLEVVALLDRLTRQAGRTLLMVTHSPDVAGRVDRSLTLEKGHLIVTDSGPGAAETALGR